MELLEELGDVTFEGTSALIADVDAPPPLDHRLAAFIDQYAKFCGDLYSQGFVPPTNGEPSFTRQRVRAYRHAVRRSSAGFRAEVAVKTSRPKRTGNDHD